MALKELNNPSVRVSCYCDHEVINVREDQALENGWVEGGEIDDKQQRRGGGALWSVHSNRWKPFQRALEEKPAPSVGEKTAYPRDDVPVGTVGS